MAQDHSEGGEQETEKSGDQGMGKIIYRLLQLLQIMACAVIQGIKSSGKERK